MNAVPSVCVDAYMDTRMHACKGGKEGDREGGDLNVRILPFRPLRGSTNIRISLLPGLSCHPNILLLHSLHL